MTTLLVIVHVAASLKLAYRIVGLRQESSSDKYGCLFALTGLLQVATLATTSIILFRRGFASPAVAAGAVLLLAFWLSSMTRFQDWIDRIIEKRNADWIRRH